MNSIFSKKPVFMEYAPALLEPGYSWQVISFWRYLCLRIVGEDVRIDWYMREIGGRRKTL